MQDTAKYLVHADITADGVVERSDVVGAVFGQTEGLLGDELDLRELQDSSKVGRIDVEIDSQNGQSFGRITIATSLDQVETAILGAALETIDRVGPCRSTIEVRKIEDVRAAKRREVVERAKALFGEAFDDSVRSSRDLVEEVREAVRVEDITEYEGLPAGPRVADSDAIVVVEGRADVLTLLRYGIKNAIAVEGTNVPDAVAELTESKTVTVFLDGDRGGELIRKELSQVGDIDYVAFAPEGKCVEDLARHEVMAALREKVPHEQAIEAAEAESPSETPSVESSSSVESASGPTNNGTAAVDASAEASAEEPTDDTEEADDTDAAADIETTEPGESEATATEGADDGDPGTLRGHVRETIGDESGRARLLDADFRAVEECPAADAFDCLVDAEAVPTAVVVDGELNQRLLDVAAQRGVDQVVAASTGEFVKQPTSVRVRTADVLLAANEA
ncbi:DNA primase [Natronomonas sp. CBA1123]|uniref:DNA primase DnaG n=1 Tax=Natronomonas sp. CBA1123 TaxID=2668070 RepID=UPI0012EAC7B1|nr:DNA primase DnaG [Natronomonas sp. CBA1123]MUV87716.1 DNA primase [Natronomonas sp. CBA1123]